MGGFFEATSQASSAQAENDLREKGKFSCLMEAKDRSQGFDFEGVYEKVEPLKRIFYTMEDGRKGEIYFKEEGNSTLVEEIFDAEKTHSKEMQQTGWQAILDNFKAHVEQN